MTKDPAFLFYAQDFYAGTRDMLPEERACYIDLLIYQHQKGIIPDDIKRLMMYCSGVGEATLQATLEAKFKKSDKGWYNERLGEVMEERSSFKENASQRGKLGALFKLAKGQLKKSKYSDFRKLVYDKLGADEVIKMLLTPQATLQATLDGLLKHLEDEVEIEDENENESKGVIVYPFSSEEFISTWKDYKNMRKRIHKKEYTDIKSENRKLTELKNKAEGVEVDAIKMLQNSIDNGWQGFFALDPSEKEQKENSRNELEQLIAKAQAERSQRG